MTIPYTSCFVYSAVGDDKGVFISSSQDQSIRLNQVCRILLWLTSNVANSVNTNNGLSLFFGWLYSGPVIKTRQNVFIFVKATHKVLIQLLWMFPNQRWWNRLCTYSGWQLPVAFNLLNSRSNCQFTVLSCVLLNFNKLIDFFLLIFGHLMSLKDTC